MMTTGDEPPKGTERDAPLPPKLPSKKPSVKKAPVAKKAPAPKKEAPKKEAPKQTVTEATLTQEDFEVQMQQLSAQARANGLNTMRSMAHIFTQQIMKTADSFLSSLEDGNTPTPTKKKR